MNTASRIPAVVALSLAAAGSVWAQEATYDYPQATSSSLTRAQVQAELATARADGSMKVWSTQYNPLTVAQSLLTREQVRAERSAPKLNYTTEDSGSFALSGQDLPLQDLQSRAVLAQRTR